MKENELGKAALHVHTTFSDGEKTPHEILEIAAEMGFSVLAITDHDEIRGALEAFLEAETRGLPISVIIGHEVTTAEGHLIILGAWEKIPSMLSLKKTIKLAHLQEALAIIPHPAVGPSFASVKLSAMISLYKNAKGDELPDGLETLTPYHLPAQQEILAKLANELNLAQIGVDDDHFGNLGRGPLTLFVGKTPDDLRRSIIQKQTLAVRSNLTPNRVSLGRRLDQVIRGLTYGLPEKVSRTPVLFSTLVSLKLEAFNDFLNE